MDHPVILLKVAGDVTRNFISEILESQDYCGKMLAERIRSDKIDPLTDYYVSRFVSWVSEHVIREKGNAMSELGPTCNFLGNQRQEIYLKQRCFEGDRVLQNFSRSPYKIYEIYSSQDLGSVEQNLNQGQFGRFLKEQLNACDEDLRYLCWRLTLDMDEDRPSCSGHILRSGTKVLHSPFNTKRLQEFSPTVCGEDVFGEDGEYPECYGFITYFKRYPRHSFPALLIASYTYYWPWDLRRRDGEEDYEPVSLIWELEQSGKKLKYIATRSHWLPIIFEPQMDITDPKEVRIYFSRQGHTPVPVPASRYRRLSYNLVNQEFIDSLGRRFGPIWSDLVRAEATATQPRGQPQGESSSDYRVEWGWIPHKIELENLLCKRTIPFQAFVNMVADYYLRLRQGRSYTAHLADSMGYSINRLGIVSLTATLTLGMQRERSLYF